MSRKGDIHLFPKAAAWIDAGVALRLEFPVRQQLIARNGECPFSVKMRANA
jgi:hypothetical protein